MAKGVAAAMTDPIQAAKQVLEQADAMNPYMRVLMFSGGKDSQATFEVCKILGVQLDAIVHVVTGCGLPETTEYVRQFAESTGIRYVEADSGDQYEQRVKRKGFYGVGTGMQSAHSFAFRELKRDAYVHALAELRERKRGRQIFMINGARVAESANRDVVMRGKYIKCDRMQAGQPASPNWWVSPLLDWTDTDRTTFLREQKCPINPVSQALCRSAECLCGTTQGMQARAEASAYNPEWGKWLDGLDEHAKQRFGFGWGKPMPVTPGQQERKFQKHLEAKGQLRLPFADDSPMCSQCRAESQSSVLELTPP